MFMHASSVQICFLNKVDQGGPLIRASKSRIEINQFGDLNVEWLFKMMMQHDLQHLHI